MSTINLHAFKNRLTVLQTIKEIFSIDNHLTFVAGRNSMTVAEIANDHAEAMISLEGGHVMNFVPQNQEPLLWLSDFMPMDANKAIRGGIPICWPWFGIHPTDSTKSAHGFARITPWVVKGTKALENGATQIIFGLKANENTRKLWPYEFQALLTITIGSELKLELMTRNTGKESFTLTQGLHSYFNVSDVRQVTVQGLENCEYLDAADNWQRKQQIGAITISGETNRVYLDTTADCVIEDPGFKRKIRIAKTGSKSTVVWNPWIEKAARFGDFGYEGYLKMLCVETTNVGDDAITLAPGEEHCLQALISIEN